ncbi:NAD-dependent epimerase/dehydratase family protein [Allomuricauda sp. d1]|uniref:NAD-dependent epimerase/dehydratase family protein n=1 Tax=Allomuricauda sp. d1 TaxID=3136725 RepID=UPI0031DEA32B
MHLKSLGFDSNFHILVTSGSRFIGSNLCEALLDDGNQVTCLDNFSAGKRENIVQFLDNPRFSSIEGDIRDLQDFRKACDSIGHVLHQATLGSVYQSINEPIASNGINIYNRRNRAI